MITDSPPEMTESEGQQIAEELRSIPDFFVQMDGRTGFYLVSMLQLALRNAAAENGPQMTVCGTVRRYAVDLQNAISPPGSLTHEALERGWDPALDVPPPDADDGLIRAVKALLHLSSCMACGPGWTHELFHEVQEFAWEALRAAPGGERCPNCNGPLVPRDGVGYEDPDDFVLCHECGPVAVEGTP